MRIRRISSNREFEVTKEEYATIVGNGNSYKYQILEDDTPLEIKSLRAATLPTKQEKKKTTKE